MSARLIAALPMYDRPSTAKANDRLWQLIRGGLPDAPQNLTRNGDPWWIWQSPDLLLAQTCGLPFRSRLKGQVTYVGTPDPDLPDTPPGHYRSAIVLHHNDPARDFAALAPACFAVNEALSQSGWAALVTHAAGQGFAPKRVLVTGSHAASAMAVATGRARAAAIDLVTWNLIRIDFKQLRLLELTVPTPALPLITARGRDPLQLARAADQAAAAMPPDMARALGFTRLLRLSPAQYFDIPLPPPLPDA